ncbi:MAG: ABC transporter ATP-binding protein [Clostridia bacterium]|nr:ABC transporter ATP-binding protein [Clostridia bacterium]NCC43956.1 ABC transporter ATP-binding protein [Clostridia bacterium]
MGEIIRTTGLTKDYKAGKGIFDFDFSVQQGEVFGLVGTNGSGKTTTIRHMMGFLKGDSGKVKIKGRDSWKHSAQLKKLIGYVPGQIDFPDVGTGTAFLKIQADFLGMKDLTYMNVLIDRFKIDITAPLKTMSKGMKQKMALVAAFMSEPEIYLLDEPSTGLDPLMRDTLIDVILEQKAKGKTIFMSSHIFKELEDTCDTVLFIKNGHIINQVKRSEYERNPIEQYEIRFSSREEYKRYTEDIKHKPMDEDGQKYLVSKFRERNAIILSIPQNRIQEFLQDLSKYDLQSIDNASYSLEKYYIEMIESEDEKND